MPKAREFDQKRKETLLKELPKVDESIVRLEASLDEPVPKLIVKLAVRKVIQSVRQDILSGQISNVPEGSEAWEKLFLNEVLKKTRPRLRQVINGTGIVVHTNLGRSLLAKDSLNCLQKAAGTYTNLEFDLDTGKRGSRYALVEEMLCEITGAESGLIVNNNAAAVLLCLDTLAKGKEAIVSRGQLVEIGGSFRIPDVMAKSGAIMREVGATNRTHLYDYEKAINDETALLLRVHCSNFRIVGFTSEVEPSELVALAEKHGLQTMEDLGSGCLVDLSAYGFPKEPTVQEIVKAGVDVVTFSGDKLLGGPQAGIIVGRRKVIDKIKKNPLNRALRIDKFTLAALESVLREYYDLKNCLTRIPTLSMITASAEEVKRRIEKMSAMLGDDCRDTADIISVETTSRVGGGALPEFRIASWALAILPKRISVATFEQRLRMREIPIIGRIENERFFLDGRTLLDSQLEETVAGLLEVLGE